MSTIKIKDNVHWIGVKDPGLRVFDVIMSTEKGTTYNSYLIDDEKVAIIDAVKTGFYEEYIKNIKEVIGDRKVDYIIVNHTELDHSGSLKELIEEYPEATVYGSKPAIMYLKNIVNGDFTSHTVADGETLSLGKRTLKFISAPFLHWPDTMFEYSEFDKILFTCDAFGSHYCSENMFDDEAGDFSYEFKYYFDVIMGPFKKHVLTAMDKIEDLDMDMICTSHGPILRTDPKKRIPLYRKWSQSALKTREEKVVSIFYVTAYNNTEHMAEVLKDTVEKAGFKTNLFNITSKEISELVDMIENSDALLIGSPTINQDALKPVWDLLSQVSPITNRGKIGGAFGSYGWSGEAVGMINQRLKSLKFRVVDEGIRVNFVPSDKDIEDIVSYGNKVVEALNK
jgi:flavorubredoxin